MKNPNAFPLDGYLTDKMDNFDNHEPEGMRLRDYFAARYMQANSDNEDFPLELLAIESYKMADEMLKAREL